jgi:hypothetical protein
MEFSIGRNCFTLKQKDQISFPSSEKMRAREEVEFKSGEISHCFLCLTWD